MKIVPAFVAVLFLAACADQQQEPAGPSLTQIKRECDYQKRPFEDSWPCIRVSWAYSDPFPDVRALYFATGDYIAEQTREGKMTQAEAKLAEAQAHQQAYQTVAARLREDETARTNRLAATASALAASGGFRRVVMPAAVPPKDFICQKIGNVVHCQ